MTPQEKTYYVEGFLCAYNLIFKELNGKNNQIRINFADMVFAKLSAWEKSDETELIEFPKYKKNYRENKSELV